MDLKGWYMHTSMFEDIVTKEQLEKLDKDLCIQGYVHGYSDTPNHARKEQSYWHGYMNGQVDSGRMPISITQLMLAADIVSKKVGN